MISSIPAPAPASEQSALESAAEGPVPRPTTPLALYGGTKLNSGQPVQVSQLCDLTGAARFAIALTAGLAEAASRLPLDAGETRSWTGGAP